MIYITGDTHGDFRRVAAFCDTVNSTPEDTLIILGDAGINYYEDYRDVERKNLLSSLPITLFCIHGNHEARPESTGLYRTECWHGGTIFVEETYPNILFAKDGEVFDLDGIQAIVIGGIDQTTVDKSTEEWLDDIEEQLSYRKWYCGHYHTEKRIDKLEFMFENIKEFMP